jgi:hypothetical protein
LTDGQGRTVDFTISVLIMTSNMQGDPSQYFRPEFINRVDDIIRFRSLSEDDLRKIVEIQIDRLRHRLAERRIGLTVSRSATVRRCSCSKVVPPRARRSLSRRCRRPTSRASHCRSAPCEANVSACRPKCHPNR